ncbi:MAG TPA: tetratricopeptide repeat protein [Polyangiaceae bacterium]
MKTQLVLVTVVSAVAFGSGCAATAAQSLRRDAEVVQKESTPEVLLRKGDAFAAVGDTTRAEQYFASAQAAGGEPHLLVRRLIRVCVADQRYRAALVYAEDYLRKHPLDDEVRFARATLAVGVGEPRLARDDLNRLVEATPRNPEVHFALAVLLRDEFGDLPAARRHFANYLALAPHGRNREQAQASAATEASP